MNKKLSSIALFVNELEKYLKKSQKNVTLFDIVDFMQIFSNKSIRKILFVLNNTEYSNQYELELLSNIHHYCIFNYLNKLKEYGIVNILDDDLVDYHIISNYWKENKPNSSLNNTFYMIDIEFSKIINNLKDFFCNDFLQSDLKMIEKRRKTWIDYKNKVRKQNEINAIEIKNAIGYCSNPDCNKLIVAKSREGKDYFQINNKKRLCNGCYHKIDPKLIGKWAQE